MRIIKKLKSVLKINYLCEMKFCKSLLLIKMIIIIKDPSDMDSFYP